MPRRFPFNIADDHVHENWIHDITSGRWLLNPAMQEQLRQSGHLDSAGIRAELAKVGMTVVDGEVVPHSDPSAQGRNAPWREEARREP